MKNKKYIYLLIPLTIVIWGLIIYKIVSYKGDGYESFKKEIKNNNTQDIIISDDTFSLFLNYPDPFLKQKELPIKSNTKRQDHLKNKNIKKHINWPKIKYNGVVCNTVTDKKKINIRINGMDYIMSKNEIIENVKLLKSSNDSIILLYQNIKKVVYK